MAVPTVPRFGPEARSVPAPPAQGSQHDPPDRLAIRYPRAWPVFRAALMRSRPGRTGRERLPIIPEPIGEGPRSRQGPFARVLQGCRGGPARSPMPRRHA